MINNNSPILKVDGIHKSYGKTHALDGLSFSIDEPEIIGLIGANGSGKTTFFKCVIGNENTDSGSIQVFGENPWTNMEVNQKILFSCNESELLRTKNNNLLNMYKIMYDNFDYNFATKTLELFNINLNMKYKNMSTGMKSIVRFTLAIASRA